MCFRTLTTGFLAAVIFFVGFTSHPAQAQRSRIKMATLAPDGSIWHEHLERMGEEWLKQTDRRVVLNLYPGGVAGDDPDMVRKMRIGQLQAAGLTIKGLAAIDPAFNVLGIPLFYESYDELEFVLRQIEPELKKRLVDRGFVLLNWVPTGWAYLFSKRPVETIDDLKQLKLFVWAGEDRMVQIWRNNGFQPVALSATDIMTGLQSGMIEAMPSTPLATLSLQWFRSTPFLLDLEIAPVFGAIILNQTSWDRISASDQEALLEIGADVERQLMDAVPRRDRSAIEEMTERGLTVTRIADGQDVPVAKTAEGFSQEMRNTGILPEEIYQLARQARDLYRQQNEVAQEELAGGEI